MGNLWGLKLATGKKSLACIAMMQNAKKNNKTCYMEASQGCLQSIFRRGLGKGYGRALVLFQYVFMTKIK